MHDATTRSIKRDEWMMFARKLDWEFSYVTPRDVYPEDASGTPWLSHSAWAGWDEPYKTSYADYVEGQQRKDVGLFAIHEALGRAEDLQKLPREWQSAVKLYAATLPLAEFAAVIGNLRMARFGRDSAWRCSATLGALDELRHTQLPLLFMHDLVRHDPQFDWTHKLYHSNDWVAIAARHMMDEMLLTANPIEFAIATNFVFETGFTNLQFVAFSAMAKAVGDRQLERMLQSIQSDEARHSQIGEPVLHVLMQHDPEYAQYLLDKWFWRAWLLFAVITGFSMDYLTPVDKRQQSFKEFMEEWILGQFLDSLDRCGLKKPWYWDMFISGLDHYHHMVYASAYSYRATVWFDMVIPGPQERTWLRQKYPRSWDAYDGIWEHITQRWQQTDAENDFAVHGTAIIGFCNLCQLVLSNGTPNRNSAVTCMHNGQSYVFCSEPCRWIFQREPERYAQHNGVVKRVLTGEAPANLIAMLRQYFGLDYASWGKDAYGGEYPWLKRPTR